MEPVLFKVGKKYVRGDRKGKGFTETVKLKSPEAIYGYLWDLTDAFDNNRCNYVVEWYTLKR